MFNKRWLRSVLLALGLVFAVSDATIRMAGVDINIFSPFAYAVIVYLLLEINWYQKKIYERETLDYNKEFIRE